MEKGFEHKETVSYRFVWQKVRLEDPLEGVLTNEGERSIIGRLNGAAMGSMANSVQQLQSSFYQCVHQVHPWLFLFDILFLPPRLYYFHQSQDRARREHGLPDQGGAEVRQDMRFPPKVSDVDQPSVCTLFRCNNCLYCSTVVA